MTYIIVENTSFMTEVTILGHCKLDLYDKIKEDAFKYRIGDLSLEKIGIYPIEIPFDI